ncbi:MAG: DUF4829 domain-containing protein [Bacillota bacterium]|nr:DUF4829 domain-containing protein [Bacillota bacterium]MDW7683588.1 DUF4829 domain-containing protein [Bacillota bacterium]
MYKRIILFIMLTSLLIQGCSSATPTTDITNLEPRELVQTFYESLEDKDYQTARACLDENYLKQLNEARDSYFNNLESLTTISISEPAEIRQPDTNGPSVQIVAEYTVRYKNELTARHGKQIRFVYVSKTSDNTPWKITSIGTGP